MSMSINRHSSLPSALVRTVAEMQFADVNDVIEGLDRIYRASGGRTSTRSVSGDHDLNEVVQDAMDGVAAFTYLYRVITSDILRHLNQTEPFFMNKDYLVRLDVHFAQRYVDALRQFGNDPRSAPRSWAVLFSRRTDTRISRLQFAVAGVNAHVTYDLL